MKSYPIQFSRLSYYKHLQIVHLFDTMHIGKNITELLWRILDGRTDKRELERFVVTSKKLITPCKVLLLIQMVMVMNKMLVFLGY
jgi:hypothetical protein